MNEIKYYQLFEELKLTLEKCIMKKNEKDKSAKDLALKDYFEFGELEIDRMLHKYCQKRNNLNYKILNHLRLIANMQMIDMYKKNSNNL